MSSINIDISIIIDISINIDKNRFGNWNLDIVLISIG